MTYYFPVFCYFFLSYIHAVLDLSGVDFGRVEAASFSMEGLPQEVIVNLG